MPIAVGAETAALPPAAQIAPTPAAAACDCPTIPALTAISVEILAPLGSKTSKTGDTFPLRLAAPLVIEGQELLPAGTPGQGEVVHAKKSGGMGAAGELVLAARFLEVDGRQLRLRSLRINPNGNSKIDTVNTIAMASAATIAPISIIGYFIKGGQATVPEGTVADAKTAEAFILSLQAAPPAETPLPATIQAMPTETPDAHQ